MSRNDNTEWCTDCGSPALLEVDGYPYCKPCGIAKSDEIADTEFLQDEDDED